MATKSPLLLACEESNKDLVVDLILKGTDVNGHDSANRAALHHASCRGWLDVAELLVRKGAELDGKSEEGDTPLLLAARLGYEAIVLLLIKAGADVTLCGNFNVTILWCALQNGWLEVVQLLEKGGVDFDERLISGETPLQMVAEQSQKQIVQFLIGKGVSLNWRDERGWTRLHYASMEMWSDVARDILEKGDVNDRAYDGKTPLHSACFFPDSVGSGKDSTNAFVEIFELLCNNGADIYARDSRGMTPAHGAFYSLVLRETSIQLKVFECFFKAGFDCNIAKGRKESLFRLFIDFDEIHLVRFGIENGGYFEDGFPTDEYPKLKEGILRNVNLCTRAIINKYNEKDLPKVYEMCHLADKFPAIKNMKITYVSGATLDIEEAVRRDMEARGYCNVPQVTPMALCMLTVKSILIYFNRNLNQ